MDADQFVDLLRDAVAVDREVFRIGTVVSVAGTADRATVRFDGETSASTKQYVALASITPAVDGRVLLARVGNSWVIIGDLPAP